MMPTGDPPSRAKTAVRPIIVARAFHASSAAVALAELLAPRASVLDPLYLAAYALALALAVPGAIAPPPRNRRFEADIRAAAWLALATLAFADFTFLEGGTGSLVRAAEALTIGATAVTIERGAGAGKASRNFLPVAASLMLLLFASVHFTQADAIASLVPAWFPERDRVPFFTAATMAAAAAGLWLPQLRSLSALLVANMFLSWLPLVHAGRLWDHPGDPSEWSFAAMAATLGACMIILMLWLPGQRRAQLQASGAA